MARATRVGRPPATVQESIVIIAFIVIFLVFASYYSAAGRRHARKGRSVSSTEMYNREYRALTCGSDTAPKFKG